MLPFVHGLMIIWQAMIGLYTDKQHEQAQEDCILAENYCYDARQANPAVEESVLLVGLMESFGWEKEYAAHRLEVALHPKDY